MADEKPKTSELTKQMNNARSKITQDIVKILENDDPSKGVGKSLKIVKKVLESESAHDARRHLEPKHPEQAKNPGLRRYFNKINKEGDDQPMTGFKLHVHGEDGGHETLFEESPEIHKLYHKSSANFYLNKEKKTFVDHFYTAQRMNMELAHFDTLNEQKNFGEKAAFENNPEIESVFISGLRTGQGWKWVKKNGGNFEYSEITYSIWDNKQPDNYKGKEMGDDDIITALVDNPKLMERPIITTTTKAIIGRPPENVLELFN